MNDQDDDEALDPETLSALTTMANAVAHTMIEAMKDEKLSPLGLMFAACVGVKAFSKAAQQVEGWTEAQRDEYLRDAIADSLKADVDAVVVGAGRH